MSDSRMRSLKKRNWRRKIKKIFSFYFRPKALYMCNMKKQNKNKNI